MLRLVLAGVFDRYPAAQVIVGHGGEALPYFLWRFDSRFAINTFGIRLAKSPSAYLRENVSVTTAGLFATPSLRCAVDGMGEDRVLFSIDYPYESSKAAGEWFDAVGLPQPVLDKVARLNAARLLRLAGTGWRLTRRQGELISLPGEPR